MSHKHVSINIFDLIDSICADFRKQWKASKRPRIEDFLLKVPENAREQLFRNLLSIDIRYRERGGDKPKADDYLEQLPLFRRVIGDAFHYSTSVSLEAAKGAPSDDSAELTMTYEAPAANRIGDYELIRELGRGGFGVVYEAKHVSRGNLVALKTLPTGQDGHQVNADRLHRFRREFRSLSEINHPNLVGMQTLEVDGSQWFFTMDLIEGEDILSYVRPNNELDEERLREALKQLVGGIIALHDQRILHRDLKPSNVLVSHDGRVSILDFGLVAELEQRTDQTASLQTQHFAGTPRYAAPEQVFGDRSPATDWYALGTMLFEALTGEPPFRGTQAELLIKKREEDAPQLAGHKDVPADLADLADGLLQGDPQQRPNADLIAEALSLQLDSITHSSRASSDDELDAAVSLDEPEQILIGREAQLAELEAAKQELLDKREPVVVWITGLSGEGKSSLAEKFLRPLRRDDEFLVLSGRCYDRESVPFKAVDVLIEALVGFLRSRSDNQVDTWLPRDTHMLASLFPTLNRVRSIERRAESRISNIDDRQIRYRAFFALSELLVNISLDAPIVVFIDDLQWGDADSAEVLTELLSPPNPPAVLLLGSYRSDEAEQSPFFQEWNVRLGENDARPTDQWVEVAPLTEEQCLAFLAQRVGMDAEELREQAHSTFADTKGNPYFLEQLIEGFNAETRQFEPVPLHDIVERKLQQLPEGAADLLQVVAIAGQAVSVEEASRVAGHDAPLFSTVTHMRSERLVRLIGSEDQPLVDTYHDKIRETVVDQMPNDYRGNLHLRFGDMLQEDAEIIGSDALEMFGRDTDLVAQATTIPDRVADLAYHFHNANDPRGFAYQLLAGEKAYSAYALEDAVEYFSRAAASLPEDTSDNVQFGLWEKMGKTFARLQQFERALECFEKALSIATVPEARSRVYLGIALLHQNQGKFPEATLFYDKALQELKRRRPRNVFIGFIRLLGIMARMLIIPSKFQKATTAKAQSIATLEQEVYRQFCLYIFEQDDVDISQYPYAMFKQAASSTANPRSGSRAAGYSWLGLTLSINGLPFLGQYFLKKGGSFSTPDDMELKGQVLFGTAIVHANARQLELADNDFKEATPVLLKCGAHATTMISVHLHRHVHAIIATPAVEESTAREEVRLGELNGDPHTICWGHYGIASARARAGDLHAAKLCIQQAQEYVYSGEMKLTEAIFLGTAGYVHLQASTYDEARRWFEQSWNLIKARKILMEYTLRTVPGFIEAICGPNWNDFKAVTAKRDGKALRRLGRVGWLMHKFYPNLQSPIQRVRGRTFWLLGKKRRAVRCIKRAVKCARDLGTDYDLAKSLLDLAAVKEHGRDENRRDAIELLKRMESVIPRAESWLLGEHYEDSLVAPEFDLETWEKENGHVRSEFGNNDQA